MSSSSSSSPFNKFIDTIRGRRLTPSANRNSWLIAGSIVTLYSIYQYYNNSKSVTEFNPSEAADWNQNILKKQKLQQQQQQPQQQ